MKVHIHPHYAAYESYIRAIPSEEYEREEVYCNRRNTVERVRFGDKDFVIKKYKRPALINCLIYTWFRKSKAQRAFEYAELFLQRGCCRSFSKDIRKYVVQFDSWRLFRADTEQTARSEQRIAMNTRIIV